MIGDEFDSPGVLKVNTSRHERYVDDLTGQPLPPEVCRKARATELEYFKDKEVWTMRKGSELLRRQGTPPITVRWVEVNKDDGLNPKIRSRLVAREIRFKGEEAIFAPTPPVGVPQDGAKPCDHTVPERAEERVGLGQPGPADDILHGHPAGIFQCPGRRGRPCLCRAAARD